VQVNVPNFKELSLASKEFWCFYFVNLALFFYFLSSSS